MDRFVAPPHPPIWRALAETVRRKMQFSIDTLKLLEPDVDERYVAELVADKPERPPNLEHHVEAPPSAPRARPRGSQGSWPSS